MDYLYGELNQNLVNLANYKGLDNGDAKVLVDNTERTIGVDLGGLKDSIASSYVSATKDQEVGGTKTFTDDITIVGTTKLMGGLKPIKSYTVNADYRGTQTTLVLNVFTENYVESSKMYSFFGSASATALGVGEFICNGSYRLDTNGNLDSAVLLTTMRRNNGSYILACQYENGQLVAGNLAFYDDIESVQTWANGTFAQLGNPNNFRSSNVFNGNLIANGTLKLTGGFEPIKSYTINGTLITIDGEGPQVALPLNIFIELPVDSNIYSFFGSIDIDGEEYICNGSYKLGSDGNIESMGCLFTNISSDGTSNMKCIYANNTITIVRILDLQDYIGLMSYLKLLEQGTQTKLYTHTLTLTADKSYTLVYQSTNQLKAASPADLRTIMNVASATDNVILPVCLTDLTGTAVLQVTTSVCKIGTADVTAVSDSVPADATGE